MPHVDWTTPRAALVAGLALTGLPADAAARAIGTAVLAELDALGAAYEGAWAAYGTTVTANESAYAMSLSSWTALLSTLWADATAVCSYLENKVYLGRVGRELVPRALNTALGDVALTEHTDTLPSPWDDPVATVTASRTLDASGGVPVLRVEALPDGMAGNAVKIAVSAATSGRSSECKITLTRGTTTGPYVEVYDNVDLAKADATAPNASSSRLVRSFTIVGQGRPVDLSSSFLTGGRGGVFDAMDRRLACMIAAAQSGDTALTETDRRTAEALRDRMASLWSQKPELINPVEEAQEQLEASIARASQQTALLTAVYGP